MEKSFRKLISLSLILILLAGCTSVSVSYKPIKITVLGDSIAKGTGDETKKGISGNLKEYFEKNYSKNIDIKNYGVNGLKSSGLIEMLKSKSVKSEIANSDFIVLSIGGNDILSLYGLSTKEIENDFVLAQDNYIYNLEEIITIIREINKNAYIVFIGLYYPSNIDFLKNTALINSWNDASEQLLKEAGRATFISTFDLVESNLKKYISSDGLHPDAIGYKAISYKITTAILNEIS